MSHIEHNRNIYMRGRHTPYMPETTTSEQTVEYIKEHPFIKHCLKRGLINYSALARMIAHELSIEKKTSNEAILVAARRFKEKLQKEQAHEGKIRAILTQSEIEIKNKIVVFILERNFTWETIQGIEKRVRSSAGTFYLLEGSDNYTLIIQERFSSDVTDRLRHKVIKTHKQLALINFKSPKTIENTHGVLAYLTSLFAENGVNVVEFLSCWTDTLFVIDADAVGKAIDFLQF